MKLFLYAAGFSLVLSGAAFAHPKMPNFDLNADGKVTLAEYQQGHADRMLKLDANKDGKITETEFMSRPDMMDHDGPSPRSENHPKKDGEQSKRHRWMEKMRTERQAMMFDMLDVNDDAAISRSEADRMTAKHFKRLDKNNDTVLTGEELPKPPKMGGHRKDHGSH
jgi:Ca2+-binding EF-hand superfamily protein